MAAATIDREKIWGPNRAALKREQNRPRLVNDAIEQAALRGSRFVLIPMQHESDAKEMAEYINANSSYEAKVNQAPPAPHPSRPSFIDDKPADAVDYAFERVKALLWTLDVERTGKYFCVSFWLPAVSGPELVAYETKVKEHRRLRDEEIQRLHKLQHRQTSVWPNTLDNAHLLPVAGTVLDPTNE